MLTVNDIMTIIPHTVTPDTPLRHVIELMKTEGCRQLPGPSCVLCSPIPTEESARGRAGAMDPAGFA